MPNSDVHAKQHFLMPSQTTFKKAKFLEFAIKNDNQRILSAAAASNGFWLDDFPALLISHRLSNIIIIILSLLSYYLLCKNPYIG